MDRCRRTLWAVLVLLLALPLLAVGRPAVAESPQGDPGQGEIIEAKVVRILEEGVHEVWGQRQPYQKLELTVLTGPRRGERLVVDHGTVPELELRRFRAGDWIFLRYFADSSSGRTYVIETHSRWLPLAVVTILFVAAVVLVARWRGAASLVGLVISFGVVFAFVLPRLAAGAEPLSTILIGGALTVPLTFYLAHGVSVKTTVAVVGTAASLVVTVLLAQAFVGVTKLTGYASEEAAFLQMMSPTEFDVRGLLLAGIVVSVLGVLDDVTVSQAAIVQQLHEANPGLDRWELFRRAMHVGRDHIASMVNTLALVYAGAALPLLLLLRSSDLPLTYLLSQEIIAEEVVRMLVSSIGLMGAVPMTTVLAAYGMTRRASRRAPAA